jgi:4-hydroxy-tetrahydrodipicolinate reductase
VGELRGEDLEMLKLAVTGAGGRMGRRIVALAHGRDFEVVAALEAAGNLSLGQDAGVLAGLGTIGVAVSEDVSGKPEVMIDFSLPLGTLRWAKYCGENLVPLVVGTTGLTEQQKQILRQAAQKTAVLMGANMSLGVNLLFKLAEEVAGKLSNDYDIEVVETHNRFKRDAPSGTALEMARHMAAARQWPWPDCMVHGREGKESLRRENTIGMHAVRGGDIVGEHSIVFSALGETVELRHQAHSRDTFVRGALHAAQWLVQQEPGMYSMFDVLGL